MPPEPTSPSLDDLQLRPARADDVGDLVRLAALEGAPPLPGPVLVAGKDGRILAALCLSTGRAVANPFVPSQHLVDLLRQHADHRSAPMAAPRGRRLMRRLLPVSRSQRAYGVKSRMSDPTRPIEIEMLPAAASDDPTLMELLTDLINEVYAVAESGLWAEGATRTKVDEVAELTRTGEIAVARLCDRVVGCVRIQRLDANTGEFGMLAADPAHRGVGIGRELARFAERKCRAEGLRTMQLELLVPRGWTHPSKEFLHSWYTRIGYRVARTGTIDEAYPGLAPLLATPCDFVIYQKDLAVEQGGHRPVSRTVAIRGTAVANPKPTRKRERHHA